MEVLTLAITPRDTPADAIFADTDRSCPTWPGYRADGPSRPGARPAWSPRGAVPVGRDPRGLGHGRAGRGPLVRGDRFLGWWPPAQDLARLGVGSAPEESTLRKLFARLDADRLDEL